MFDSYYSSPDIIIGKAEIFYSRKRNGWIVPGGILITDKIEAVNYACRLHDLLTQQTNIKKQKEIQK